MPQVVDATALGGVLPVERADHGIAVQLGTHVRRQQQVVRALAQGEPLDDRQHPVGDGHATRAPALGGLHLHALGSRATHVQRRGGHLDEVTDPQLASLGPTQSGPAKDEHHVGQARVALLPREVGGFEFILGEGVHLHRRRGTLGHADGRDGVGGDQLLPHAPGEEDREAGPVANHGVVAEPPREQGLEGASDLAPPDGRHLQRHHAGGHQTQQLAVGLPGLRRDGRATDLEPAGEQVTHPLLAGARINAPVQGGTFTGEPGDRLATGVEGAGGDLHTSALEVGAEAPVGGLLDAHAAARLNQASTSARR